VLIECSYCGETDERLLQPYPICCEAAIFEHVMVMGAQSDG
jgi:hypothetical protein